MQEFDDANRKVALRKQYLSLRKEMQLSEWERLNTGILEQFEMLDLPALKKPSPFVHTFLAIQKNREPNTHALADLLTLKFPGIQWVISKSDRETAELYHFLWESDTLIEENAWGIPEPIGGIRIEEALIDVVFVPLLVADRRGHRVGYGKGFYDRFLIKCRPDTIKIGISMFDLTDQEIPILPTDIPLDLCVTPTETIWFNKLSET